MDTAASAISVTELSSLLGSPRAPLVIDVRGDADFDADRAMIAGALRRAPERVGEWGQRLPDAGPLVAYCTGGNAISRRVANALLEMGIEARILEGGIVAWRTAHGPAMLKQPALGIPSWGPSRWITRERPKIDRIACPWLIRRFVDPLANFLFVPADRVLRAAGNEHAIPYDIPGVEFSHAGELCSFDAFLKRFGLDDPLLRELAVIVRGADTRRPDLAPQAPGLLAISLGLSAIYENDAEMLERGMLVYDALYAWLKVAGAEARNAKLLETK